MPSKKLPKKLRVPAEARPPQYRAHPVTAAALDRAADFCLQFGNSVGAEYLASRASAIREGADAAE